MTDTNTINHIYALGDAQTSERLDMLVSKAAEHGAVIRKMFTFAPGEAATADDLSTVDAVVEALSRAIAHRRDVWLPFWLQDLCREQHLRSLSLTLQRHGLNLLLGPQLLPCPADGGLNQTDAALRAEVRAVWALDDAALAAAGMRALGAEIEAALAGGAPEAESPVTEVPVIDAPDAPAGAAARECHFSTATAAALLGKSPDWLSRGLREQAFRYADGSAVQSLRHPTANRRSFTVPMVRAIAWSAYRRGALSAHRLEEVLAELARSAR